MFQFQKPLKGFEKWASDPDDPYPVITFTYMRNAWEFVLLAGNDVIIYLNIQSWEQIQAFEKVIGGIEYL